MERERLTLSDGQGAYLACTVTLAGDRATVACGDLYSGVMQRVEAGAVLEECPIYEDVPTAGGRRRGLPSPARPAHPASAAAPAQSAGAAAPARSASAAAPAHAARPAASAHSASASSATRHAVGCTRYS